MLRRFNKGDYVYQGNKDARTSLDTKAKPKIYRVLEVKPTGVIMLELSTIITITVHVGTHNALHPMSLTGWHLRHPATLARCANSLLAKNISCCVTRAEKDGTCTAYLRRSKKYKG